MTIEKKFQNNVFDNNSSIFNKLPYNSLGLNFNQGEPYIFLKDFSFINSKNDGTIGSNLQNFKKDQVVFPFPSSNVRMMQNPAFTKAIKEGVLVKKSIVAEENKSDKYRVNKDTKIFKANPNKKDIFGDIGADIVGNLKKGDIITNVKKGFGGRGIAPTPYLIFEDGTYIFGYDADLLNANEVSKQEKNNFGNDADLLNANEVSKLEKNKNLTTIALLILVGFLTYKLVKK